MLEFTVRAGEALVIGPGIRGEAVTADLPYRHHYRCWLCKHEDVLAFEPDASQPSWAECDHCGLDNEIPAGVYDRPALIPGHIPTRIC
jgi:hypothetical protein